MSEKVILELKGICKTFNRGSVNEKVALRDFNLSVNEGDFITVIGGNGAGKSTLMNVICGTFPVDEGSIILGGKDVTRLPEYRRAKYLGRVFQDPMMGTSPNMEIQENLALAYRRGKLRSLMPGIRRSEKQFYREQLSRLGLGLEDRMTAKVGLLSGGQRQSLTLLMATLKRPELLLLDEHTAALDPKAADVVMELTDKLVKEKKITSLMVTHNLRYAVEYGTRTIMMHDGDIIMDVSGAERTDMGIDNYLKVFNEISLEKGN